MRLSILLMMAGLGIVLLGEQALAYHEFECDEPCPFEQDGGCPANCPACDCCAHAPCVWLETSAARASNFEPLIYAEPLPLSLIPPSTPRLRVYRPPKPSPTV